MPKEFTLEDPGEGIHEAEILEVQVNEGDVVEEGDVVLAVETDKAAVDIPAPFSGTIENIAVTEGDRVEVGDVLMTYTEAGEEGNAEGHEDVEPEEEAERDEDEEEEPRAEEPEAEQEREESERPQRAKGRPVPASPSTRRLARELDIDLHDVEPSGPNGRITAEDVHAAAEEDAPDEAEAAEEAPPEEREERPAAPEPTAIELPDFSQWGEVERVAVSSIRSTTARRMEQAWQAIPHVTHVDVADMTALEEWRRAHREQVEEQGGTLSLTVLVLKAVTAALKDFPRFNASFDPKAEEVILKRYFHVGVAVDTDEGLVVPVVRDVDRKSVAELARTFEEVIQRTRQGEVSPEELQGGSFTVTNPGPLGGTAFTPIINPPQVAILGMARAELEPVVRGDLEDYEVVPRLRLPLCLAFDHRANDGADAARFVGRIIELLEDPEAFLLAV